MPRFILDFSSARSLLLPRLQHRLDGAGRPFGATGLEIGITVAGPEGTVAVTESDLREWGVSFEEVLPMALSNLRDRSHRKGWQDVATVPGMVLYHATHGDAAARALLLAELLDLPAEGAMFAVPAPDQLLVVPLWDLDHLDAVRVLVTAAHLSAESSPRPLTDQVFWFDGETIIDVPVVHTTDNVDIHAPPALLAAVERLATLAMMPAMAEA